ncbi:MmyB family transcriptional regulator [Streptomyces sp. CB00455]|uniref:MmyB family transcriptional regulator n=1 Tax=Streptomyces sp. CB00455 TaxID=1703927 RepID=UPI003FD15E0E
MLEKLADKTGKGGFYRLADFGINGAFHLDVLCTNAEGAERSRERLVLRKSEPSEGALVCKPLIGFMVGDECHQVGSDPGLQLTEGGTECLKVVVTGQHGQELQDVAAVVSGDLQEVDNCHGRPSDKVSTGEAFQSAEDSLVGTVIVLGVERGDQGPGFLLAWSYIVSAEDREHGAHSTKPPPPRAREPALIGGTSSTPLPTASGRSAKTMERRLDNRADIRDFLARRRAQLTPERVGLPTSGRRRVPGLRREEVAVLAGVSTEWYTRLEKGHISGVSDDVLDAVAHTLQLDEDERTYLFDLAKAAHPGPRTRRRRKAVDVPPRVQWLLDSMTLSAAFVSNGRLDIVATNPLARALFAPTYASCNLR